MPQFAKNEIFDFANRQWFSTCGTLSSEYKMPFSGSTSSVPAQELLYILSSSNTSSIYIDVCM